MVSLRTMISLPFHNAAILLGRICFYCGKRMHVLVASSARFHYFPVGLPQIGMTSFRSYLSLC